MTPSKNTAKVFQGLIDLIESETKEGNRGSVPREIQSLVSNFQRAHETFEKGIHEYMHRWGHDVSEFKTVERIVEKDPSCLISRDKSGHLPICNASFDDFSASTYVPFFAKAAIQHGVLADESERGGLLIRVRDSKYTPLQRLVRFTNISALKALQNSKPPLFKAADIRTECLIHIAASGGTPLHKGRSLDLTKLLLKSAIKYDPHHISIGGLFAKNKQGAMSINCIINKFGKKDAIKCIEESLSTSTHIPILHKAIQHTPEYVDDIITSFPDSCFVRDENGRLPIHVALETGMKWSTSLLLIMNANSEYLGEIDPLTQFCPIALAAVEPACDLRTINYLLQKHPKQVEFSMKTINKKVRSSSNDDHEHKSKRQRFNA
jgi:hypothetical protein